jgi:ATP-dependent exoDNAse (exonuclease V) alpha subunit
MDGRQVTIPMITVKDEDCARNTITFMPLKLAWALSIHKSQGMTLDALVLDLGNSIFEYGQAYVALSRARNLASVRILAVEKESFKTHPDVLAFYRNITAQT